MRPTIWRSALLLIGLLLSGVPAAAQVAEPNAAGVAMGQLHYVVRDVDANRRFWMTLGGTPGTGTGNGPDRGADVITFPGVRVILERGDTSGGTEGSVLNHVAFRVPSLAAVSAAGLTVQLTTGFPGVASVRTPEGERIELFDDSATNLTFVADDPSTVTPPAAAAILRHRQPVGRPIMFHHIHLYVPEGQAVAVKAWYARVFGGVAGKRSNYDAVDLPGVNMNFSGNAQPHVPIKGRMLDRIGFEVRNLQAFCARLESSGVKLDAPYAKGSDGVGRALLTDPWGTALELIEPR